MLDHIKICEITIKYSKKCKVNTKSKYNMQNSLLCSFNASRMRLFLGKLHYYRFIYLPKRSYVHTYLKVGIWHKTQWKRKTACPFIHVTTMCNRIWMEYKHLDLEIKSTNYKRSDSGTDEQRIWSNRIILMFLFWIIFQLTASKGWD